MLIKLSREKIGNTVSGVVIVEDGILGDGGIDTTRTGFDVGDNALPVRTTESTVMTAARIR